MRRLSRRHWTAAIVVAAAAVAAPVVALVALRPHGASEPVNDFTRWRPVSGVEIGSRHVPASAGSVIGWSHGFLMTAGVGSTDRSGVLASRDGLHWTAAFPAGLKHDGKETLTAYQSTAFLVGVDDSSPGDIPGEGSQPVFYDVWTSADGTTWTKIADRLDFLTPSSVILGFAAGPRGIDLLTDYTSTYSDGGSYGLYATVSTDGRHWPAPIPVPTRTLFDLTSDNMLTANPSGFTITAAREISAPEPGNPRALNDDQGLYLTSSDGVHWTDSSASFASADRLRTLADGASGTVICGNAWVPADSPLYGSGAADGALTCWHRRQSGGRWQAELPSPGHLPDAGVAALGDQEIFGLCTDRTGFIAVGGSATSSTAEIGAIWVSSDGTTWNKVPTSASGLTHFAVLESVAEYNGVAIATGFRVSGSDTTSYEISTPPQP